MEWTAAGHLGSDFGNFAVFHAKDGFQETKPALVIFIVNAAQSLAQYALSRLLFGIGNGANPRAEGHARLHAR